MTVRRVRSGKHRPSAGSPRSGGRLFEMRQPRRTRCKALLLILFAAVLVAMTVPGSAGAAVTRTQDVLYVGNNWDGTADVIDPQTFTRIARLNIIPDKEQRMAEI